jgi:cell division protein FtsB
MKKFLDKIPVWMASKTSIFIYLFLFFYLVIFAILCVTVPGISHWTPSANSQLVLGNYTNVLSALGASIAAGAGVVIHTKVKDLHEKHDELHKKHEKLHHTIDKLHEKLDQLSEKNRN